MMRMVLLHSLCFIQLAFSPNHLFPSLLIHTIPADNMPDTSKGPLSDSVASDFHYRWSNSLKPRHFLNLGGFNERALMRGSQQPCLLLTVDSLAVDVCCVSEMQMQNIGSEILIFHQNIYYAHRAIKQFALRVNVV